MSDFDTKFNDGPNGTITDDNYTDPYTGNDDDPIIPIGDGDTTITEDDIKDEDKGKPEDNEFIPLDERDTPFQNEEEQLLIDARNKKILLAIGTLGLLSWLN